MVSIAGFLSKRSRFFVLTAGVLLIVLVGVLDYATGYEIGVSTFYLLPIALVAWFGKKWYGVITAVLAALVWLLADLLTAHVYSSPLIPYWNALVRLGLFLPVALALSALEAAFRKQRVLVHDLQEALARVRTLSGLLPICASCKRIRDDQGYWKQLEAYIQEHSEAEFSHSLCPECLHRLYPDLYPEK